MGKLSKWIRKKIRPGSHNTTNNDPKPLYMGIPILPQKRQHILTPSPSHSNLAQSPLAATASSPFFQRLRLELRRQICIAAFGARTVHMDLRWGYSEIPGKHHARTNGGSYYPPDRTLEPSWDWWSSVCHRNPRDEGWMDQCRTGLYNTPCWMFPGKMPDKCFIGVMGWLLTCRRA